jgi:hypothetical protein
MQSGRARGHRFAGSGVSASLVAPVTVNAPRFLPISRSIAASFAWCGPLTSAGKPSTRAPLPTPPSSAAREHCSVPLTLCGFPFGRVATSPGLGGLRRRLMVMGCLVGTSVCCGDSHNKLRGYPRRRPSGQRRTQPSCPCQHLPSAPHRWRMRPTGWTRWPRPSWRTSLDRQTGALEALTASGVDLISHHLQA